MGPVIIFVAGTLLAPLGLLGNRILFALLTLIAFIAWLLQRGLDESQEWVEQKQKRKGNRRKTSSI